MAKRNTKIMTCKIPDCDQEASIKNLCKRCYSSMWYWARKTPTQIMDRQEKLVLYQSRMAVFSNVRAHPSRKKGSRKKTKAA